MTQRRGGQGGGGDTPANPWIVGLAVGAILVAISIIAFGLFVPDEEPPGPTLAVTTTTPGTDDGSSTTVPDDGSSTTTGVDDTTDTTQPTGTTVTLPGSENGEITPIGEPIPISDLTMSSNDLGPLDFGEDGDTVLGRLAATFGEPTQNTGFIVANGAWGACPGDGIKVVQWGPLNILVRGEPGISEFISYRQDLRYGGITHPATDMATLSGLRVGDTVGQLKDIYAGFAIDFRVDADLGLVFELRTERDGPLLLWGPVDSQEDTGLVTGIYSPDSCTS